jgi:DNA-binding transcriptional LysR family regulator
MDVFETMRIYQRVAELSSFTAAAQSLGLPKATVSSAVQQLESALGTRLLHRTTRKVQATQDGQVFYERSKDLVADVDELASLFRSEGASLRGRLRVDMPTGVARDVVVPRLPEFLREHPAIEIELSSTDRRVDLVREGFDCVLRVGPLADSSLIARPLGHYAFVNCASAAYVARYGEPRTIADLSRHPLIHYVQVLGGRSSGFEYEDPDEPGTARYVAMKGALTVNNAESYRGACLAGLGIVQLPEPAARPYIEAGQLVDILPGHRPLPMPVSIVYANRRHLPVRVRVFMDWIEKIMAPRLVRTAPASAPAR